MKQPIFRFLFGKASVARFSFLGLLLLFIPALSIAHDYWLVLDGDDYLLHRGHKFSQHGGEKEVPYSTKIVKQVLCLPTDKQAPQPASVGDTYPLRIKGPCAAVAVGIDSGYWSQTLTGARNQARDETFGALRSWHALESVKYVEHWHQDLLQPLTNELELVFIENPFSEKVGDKLRLVTYRNGSPVAGVTVAYNGKPRGITGSDGRINLRMREAGLQVITASIESSLNSPKAEKQVASTILIFKLP